MRYSQVRASVRYIINSTFDKMLTFSTQVLALKYGSILYLRKI